jgi:hypothetical protein
MTTQTPCVLLAACVLLAQTCLDAGAGAGAQDIAREIDEVFPA